MHFLVLHGRQSSQHLGQFGLLLLWVGWSWRRFGFRRVFGIGQATGFFMGAKREVFDGRKQKSTYTRAVNVKPGNFFMK